MLLLFLLLLLLLFWASVLINYYCCYCNSVIIIVSLNEIILGFCPSARTGGRPGVPSSPGSRPGSLEARRLRAIFRGSLKGVPLRDSIGVRGPFQGIL